LTGEQERIWRAYANINDTLNINSSQTPYLINQQAYYFLTERRQDYQYRKVAEIVNSNDSLKSWRDFYSTNANFWDTRNRKMAEHIANFIRKYPSKRYIVLTGSMHKYYLLKELEPLQTKMKFKIQEYYE
jgi:L-lactate utilization protein LutC